MSSVELAEPRGQTRDVVGAGFVLVVGYFGGQTKIIYDAVTDLMRDRADNQILAVLVAVVLEIL